MGHDFGPGRQSILVAENEFYIAAELSDALVAAGIEVLGPFPDEAAAIAQLASRRPDAAIVDLNLGGSGPSYELARALRGERIPFLFFTGYSQEVIPPDLDAIERIEKPARVESLVAAVSDLIDTSAPEDPF